MGKENITRFPKGFFQRKRPTITASEALKDTIPIEWEKTQKDSKRQIVKVVNKKKFD